MSLRRSDSNGHKRDGRGRGGDQNLETMRGAYRRAGLEWKEGSEFAKGQERRRKLGVKEMLVLVSKVIHMIPVPWASVPHPA